MADPTWDHVFSFITETEAGAGQLECHAFLCPKRKMAKVRSAEITAVVLTVPCLGGHPHHRPGVQPRLPGLAAGEQDEDRRNETQCIGSSSN